MSRFYKIKREKRRVKNYTLCIMHCALLMACSSTDDTPETKMQEMPIVISLPAEQFANPHDFETSTGGDATTKASYGATRVDPGDPGTYESFELPTHLYIFIYVKESDSQEVITYKHMQVDRNNWTKTVVGTDSVYQYNSSIPFDIPAEREEIRVYAAAWNHPLTLKNGTKEISSPSDVTSETEIQNITFDLSTTDLTNDIKNLQNLYSSPYNYNVDGKYYGTMKDVESSQPNIELMLYHVASKLDLMWNVNEDKQSTTRVTYVGAEKIKTAGCKLFKPMENDDENTTGSIGEDMSKSIGSQWLGRKSFYIIPYKNKSGNTFPVYFQMRCNDKDSGSTISQTITPLGAVFTPWIRGFITVAGNNF